MRLLLLGAIIAVAGVTGLLLKKRDPGHAGSKPSRDPGHAQPEQRPEPPEAEPLPDHRDRRGFLQTCAARGPEVVPQLLKRLRSGQDETHQPRWVFRAGKLDGFPTLRALYLATLASITGEEATAALAEVLSSTGSVEETYLICVSLQARGDRAWSVICLERAAAEPTPVTLPILEAMVELAARDNADEACAQLVRTAPRGQDPTEPRVFARALAVVPVARATATVAAVLDLPEVTTRAKARYLRALCNRPEPEVLNALRAVVDRGGLSLRIRTELAYAAADSMAFSLDAHAYQRAVAEGKIRSAASIRARFDRRMEEVKHLIAGALDVDVDRGTDPKAAALRRRLERHKKLLDQAGG